MGRMRVGYGYTLRVFRTASVRKIHVLGRIAKLPGIQLIVVLYLALRACVSEGLTIPHLPPPPKPVSHSPPTISLSPPLHFLEGRTGSMVLSSKPYPTRCPSKHELGNLRKAKASMQRKKKCAARVRIICCRVVSVFTRSELCNRPGLP